MVDGLASGINGVVDLANQAVQRQINSRLESVPPAGSVEMPQVEEELPPLDKRGEKRPRPDAEETLLTHTDEPPPYEEAVKLGLPTTRPIAPLATGVLKPESKPATLDLPPPSRPSTVAKPLPPVARARPGSRPQANWQSTLNSIVGLGVQSVKRRRCY